MNFEIEGPRYQLYPFDGSGESEMVKVGPPFVGSPAYGEGEFPEAEKAKDCICADWKANLAKLDASIMYAMIHGMEYNGKKFAYCPWCGRYIE